MFPNGPHNPYNNGYYGYPPQYQPPPNVNLIVQGPTFAVMKPPFGHGFHVFMDIVTCGVWLPIHLLCWALH